MKSKENKFDLWGILVAFGCLIHCIAFPLLANSIGAVLLYGIHNKITDIIADSILLLLSLWVGLKILVPSYKKYHHKKTPLILFIIGIIMFGVKDTIGGTVTIHYLWVFIALCLLISCHIFNIILKQRSINSQQS